MSNIDAGLLTDYIVVEDLPDFSSRKKRVSNMRLMFVSGKLIVFLWKFFFL